jgi:hypothetical protein
MYCEACRAMLDVNGEYGNSCLYPTDFSQRETVGVWLRPCPCCGEEALLWNNPMLSGLWVIQCSGCGLTLSGFGMKEAVNKWNRRDG